VNTLKELIDGYRRFKRERWPSEHAHFLELSKGQKPHTLVIACSDSRVDPASIFHARPGELFVVRNVGGIVPPFEIEGTYHGTSAALAFAVINLRVPTILVLGHAQCGGIAAALANDHSVEQVPFLASWVQLVAPAVARCRAGASLRRAVEHESIRLSLERLHTFPFVEERVRDGTLALQGAYFGIADGKLEILDRESGEFSSLDEVE
jgi:carbonic anhydrase